MKPTILYHTAQATRTRREILEAAANTASAEGLEGLTIGRLADELEMSKTGIFSHFGSREKLQLATVEFAREVFVEQVVQPALAQPRGAARLLALLENWIGYVERTVFRGGCFFAAAALEFDSRPGKVREAIAGLSKAWLVALQDEITFAQSQNQLPAGIEPAQMAFELHAFVQEANWSFKLFQDKEAFGLARRAIQERLSGAPVESSRAQRRMEKKEKD